MTRICQSNTLKAGYFKERPGNEGLFKTMSQNKEEPSTVWTRLRENARSIMQMQYNDLAKQTVDPSHCLLESDKEKMRHQQYLLVQFNRDIERLKHDGFRSRALAVMTLFIYRP